MVSRSPTEPEFNPSEVILQDLSSRLPPRLFEMWFRDRAVNCMPPNRVVISVPSRFHKSWIESRYADDIRVCARSLFNRDPLIEYQLAGEPESDEAPSTTSTSPAARDADLRAARGGTTFCSPVRQEFSFEGVVVGPSNRIAFAAALAVAESDARESHQSYNPLVIYGGPGLGKTHLLQACYSTLRGTGASRALYITAEDFANRVLDATRARTTAALLKRLDSFDCLIVDDIHFLADKDAVQDSFYQLFSEFQSKEKQVVLSCLRSPRQLTGLSDRLRSRLKSGLIARLDMPNFETRIAILQKKAAQHGYTIGSEAAESIAREIEANPRELEGALVRLLNLAGDHSRSPDVAARLPELLAALDATHVPARTPRAVGVSDIHRAVAAYYRVKLNQMVSSCRERSLVFARQVGMYLARKLTQHSLEEIGSLFGGRDHATVIYAVQKIERLLAGDARVRADLDAIRATLEELV